MPLQPGSTRLAGGQQKPGTGGEGFSPRDFQSPELGADTIWISVACKSPARREWERQRAEGRLHRGAPLSQEEEEGRERGARARTEGGLDNAARTLFFCFLVYVLFSRTLYLNPH